MEIKTLIIYPEKCNNCKDCEVACINTRTSLTSQGLSCIRILEDSEEGNFFFPIACKQCENPPCLAACPKEALLWDTTIHRVLIDRKKCVGCGTCVSVCPFGAMKLDKLKAKSYKCDLCSGDPECAKVCEPGAIVYEDVEMLQMPNLIRAAGKFV